MHGIFADEDQTSREAGSGSKTRTGSARMQHLHVAPKPRGAADAIRAFDGQAPRHKPDGLPKVSGPKSGSPAAGRDDDGHLVACNGQVDDIGGVLKSDSGGPLLRRNGPLHDLRNLLQVISSGVGVAEQRLEQGRADEVPEILRKIGGSVDKVSAQLRQMIRVPHLPLNRITAIDVAKMFATLDLPLRWVLGPAYELVVAIAPDLPPLFCVESELESVVLNLAINARDAMPTGGRVTVEVTRGARSGAGGGIILRVHDTGMGMDPGVAAKAFRPHFTTKSAVAGTGLGLAMVAAFARSLGGSVAIERTSPKGTTIAVYLPNTAAT